ncbi:MAG TPA: muconolactone Delta-isomerase family protein [Terriglobales bacterium]|nr:muconolactone Delta-isomerase family protein [Terriglobales bacterium]
MLILAIETPVEDLTESRFTREIAATEARRACDLQQSGAIRELYFRADSPAAVLVLECVDVAEAQTVLAPLPIVAAGLISFEVVPPRAYTGFARLFEPTVPA